MKFIALPLIAAAALGLAACSEKTEDAVGNATGALGNDIENTAEAGASAVDNALDSAGNEMDAAGDATENAVENGAAATENAADNAAAEVREETK